MAGNWMDDRERMIREREGRGLGDGPRYGGDEDRSWGGERVFGERESGASYGRAGDARPGAASSGWQTPDYEGASPAMQRGEYRRGRRFARQDYTGGGRFYGDDSREAIYREEYGQGGVEYGDVPAGYDEGYSPTRARYHSEGYGQPGYGGYRGGVRREMNRPASGGTGGYGHERGYGDGGWGDSRADARGDRFEHAGRHAGEFLHRAGEKVASWFAGGGEGRIHDPHYLDPNPEGRRGARGLGPQGYKRSDERISDDAHDRLTDDPWLDATNIALSVSGGEVTLSGTVENRESKHRAERLIEDMPGVTHVQNNLRLSRPNPLTSPGRGYGDSVLGAQLREAEGDAAAKGGDGSVGGRKN